IRRTATHLQIRSTPSNYITMNKSTGAIGFVMNGQQVFTFRPDGTIGTLGGNINSSGLRQEAAAPMAAPVEAPRERKKSTGRRGRKLNKSDAIYTAPELKRRAKRWKRNRSK